jgi:hypothetical protein
MNSNHAPIVGNGAGIIRTDLRQLKPSREVLVETRDKRPMAMKFSALSAAVGESSSGNQMVNGCRTGRADEADTEHRSEAASLK